MVELRVRPAYEVLSGEVALGLEADSDGLSILAIQRWRTVEAHEGAMTGAQFADWWTDYGPTLAEWDRLVEFTAEWSTIVIDLRIGP